MKTWLQPKRWTTKKKMASGGDGDKLNPGKPHCCGGQGALCGHSGAGGGGHGPSPDA